MDLIEECYCSRMRIKMPDGIREVEGQWHFCPPDAIKIPFLHPYLALEWHRGDLYYPGRLGEVRGSRRKATQPDDPRYTGQCWIGDEDDWNGNSDYPADFQAQVDIDGIPLGCCVTPHQARGIGFGGKGMWGTRRRGAIGFGGSGHVAALGSSGFGFGGSGRRVVPGSGGFGFGGSGDVVEIDVGGFRIGGAGLVSLRGSGGFSVGGSGLVVIEGGSGFKVGGSGQLVQLGGGGFSVGGSGRVVSGIGSSGFGLGGAGDYSSSTPTVYSGSGGFGLGGSGEVVYLGSTGFSVGGSGRCVFLGSMTGGSGFKIGGSGSSIRWAMSNTTAKYDFDRDELGAAGTPGVSFASVSTNGGGASIAIGIAGTFQVVNLTTGGASASGAGGIIFNDGSQTAVCSLQTNTSWSVEGRVYIPTLGTSGERFKALFGFMDVVTGTPAEGVWLEYADNVNSGKWVMNTKKTSGGAGSTSSNTTSAPVANTIVTLKITVTGTSAEFFIDGASVGTIATNVPSAATGFGACIIKSVGTTARTFVIDYISPTIAF